jgi:Flp pilus assembly protein TadD
MVNQQSDDFNDEDLGNDILDVTEEGVEEITDYDDTEEGIFSPSAAKKKSFSTILMGTVAVIALLGAGGYYFSKSNAPETASLAAQNASDPDLAAIPQPQPITNAPEEAAVETPPAPVAAAPEPVQDPAVEIQKDAADLAAAQQQPQVSDGPEPVQTAAPEMPSPPAVEETKNIAIPVPAEPASEPEPASADVVPTPQQLPEIVNASPPQQTELPPAPAVTPEEPAKEPVVAVMNPVEKDEPVYYDAPMGKALTDIPAPSMDPKRGKHESIIVVSDTITASTQDSAVAAASRALRLGRYDTALDMYDELYRANPRDERILMGRAVTLQKLGRPAEAIKAYEALLDLSSGNPDAVVNLMGLIRKEHPAVALEKLLDLKARHPGNASILAQLGVAYADAGNLEDAAKSLLQASRIEPNNPQHYFNMGVIAERMKDRRLAIRYYEKALEIDAVYGTGRSINRDTIYDRLARLR